MNRAGRRDAAVLFLFLSIFGLLSSGRLGSSDAVEQLRASITLVTTGGLGLDEKDAPRSWVPAPGGRRYEPHDIGNLVLMVPAAAAGMWLSAAPAKTAIENPPDSARALASLTCSMVAAAGCAWMFQLLRRFTDTRRALLLALAFPFATIFMAYARTAWDVLGACCCVCGVLYYSVQLARAERPARSLVLAAVTLAIACSFRYSLAPFVVPAALFCAWRARRSLSARTMMAGIGVFTALMVPSFAYNAIRTGSLLRPGTTAPMYLSGPNALDGNVLHGLYGLLVSPNRGLFVFSPLLLAAVAFPAVWRRLARHDRDVVVAYGCAACGYLLLMSKLSAWGIFGWGPRYLVPVLPIVFLAAALVMLQARGRVYVASIVVAAVTSVGLMLPTALVNWSLAVGLSSAAVNPDSSRPYQIAVVWSALVDGVQGKLLVDPVTGRSALFPDFLVARIGQGPAGGTLAAIAILLVLTGTAAMSMRSVARND